MTSRRVQLAEAPAPRAGNPAGSDAGSASWNELLGRLVRVEKGGRTIRTGYVEAVTVAADALWIAAEGVEPRAIYEKAQGHTVLAVSGRGPFSQRTPGVPRNRPQ